MLCLFIFTFSLNGGESNPEIIFTDVFSKSIVHEKWKTVEGEKTDWNTQDACLVNKNGGVILLNQIPIPDNFSIDMKIRVAKWEITYPWVNVILDYIDKDNYSTLMITPGENHYYFAKYENGQMIKLNGGSLPFDSKTFHELSLRCARGLTSFFWNEKFIASTKFGLSRPCIGFKGNPGVIFEIKQFSLTKIPGQTMKPIATITADNIHNGKLYITKNNKIMPSAGVSAETTEKATISYQFLQDIAYEDSFLRISRQVPASNVITMNILGDESKNNLFVILHDRSGEQHLILKKQIYWRDSQTITIDFSEFLENKNPFEIKATHWDGDKNQRIDFPIIAIDIGVGKTDKPDSRAGKIQINEIQFADLPSEQVD